VGLITDVVGRKAIDDFSRNLAAQFIMRLPKDRTKDARLVDSEMQIVFGHARGFQRKTKLGIFGKSRLANTFQWELMENGYDHEFARELGHKLAVRLGSRDALA